MILNATPAETAPISTFAELPLSEAVQKAITEMGYTTPSPIQVETLPILLGEPTDFLGLAATGTGKTAAFAIPLLERLDPKLKRVQALIMCPTRELAMQVAGQIELLGQFMGVRALPIYGGAPYGDQIRGLKAGMPVVVGTPGRIIDHIEKGTLDLSNVTTVILDEADEMISMGFKEEIESILAQIPRETSNTWLFSATMSRDVRRIADEFLTDPACVQINKTEMVASGIEQFYYVTSEGNKPEVICKLIDAADDFYGLIFCQTKALVADLTNYLKGRDYRADCLHGDMDQNARERTLKAYRDRKITTLVCTDVASRGIDVKDITHVINYSIPRELDNYVHRIGRTARSGKTGFAMSLVSPSQRIMVGRVERATKSRMKEGKIPTRKEIGAKKVTGLLTRFQAQENIDRAISLLGTEWKEALAAMTPEEVAGRFLTLNYPEIFAEERETTRAPGARTFAPAASVSTGANGSVSIASTAPVNNVRIGDGSTRRDTGVSFGRREGGFSPRPAWGKPRFDSRPGRFSQSGPIANDSENAGEPVIGKAVFGAKPFGASIGSKPAFAKSSAVIGEKKPFDKEAYSKKKFRDQPAVESGLAEEKPSFPKKSFGEKKAFGEKPAYAKKSYGATPFGEKKKWEKKPYAPFGASKAAPESSFSSAGGSSFPKKRDYKSGSSGKYGSKDTSYKKA